MSEAGNEYDEENRLISSNDKTYSYDKDGNQIRARKFETYIFGCVV